MPNEDFTGRKIAGYKLKSRVGEGGTATVYQAEHPEHGRCAVKILKQRTRSDPIAVKRFLREAGYGAKVQHSAVVRTYDFGEEDGIDYLALEWVDGEPLSEFVRRSGPLAPSLVSHIVTQLAAGLGAAHAVGIIHRDLKPENVVYNPSTRTAKLLDFGIARDAQEASSDRLTRTGFFVGTLQYVAPEALSGELVGEKADTFSLAKITYFLLDLKFPAELQMAIMKGLERQPDDRHARVQEFAEHVARGVDTVDEPTPQKGRGLFGAIKSLVKGKDAK
jgi:serine/threonine-protein kinase